MFEVHDEKIGLEKPTTFFLTYTTMVGELSRFYSSKTMFLL